MDIERIINKGCRRIESLPSTSVMKIQAQEKLNQKRKKKFFTFIKSYPTYDLYEHKIKHFRECFWKAGD